MSSNLMSIVLHDGPPDREPLAKGCIRCAEPDCTNQFKVSKGMPSSRPAHLRWEAKYDTDIELSQEEIRRLPAPERMARFWPKPLRICYMCEVTNRTHEYYDTTDSEQFRLGEDYCDAERVENDIIRSNKSPQWFCYYTKEKRIRATLKGWKRPGEILTHAQKRAQGRSGKAGVRRTG